MQMKTIGIWLLILLLAASSTAARAREAGFKVKSVRFEGNEVYSEKRLLGLMSTRPSRFLSRVRYHPLVLEEDIRNIALFYNQNGYLEAAVTGVSVDVDSTAGAVGITVGIMEGELTRIEGVADLTLKQLNEATQAWCEYEYNRKAHSETGQTPLARFLAGPSVTRDRPHGAALRLAFTRTDSRTQRISDGTVVIDTAASKYPPLTAISIVYGCAMRVGI